MRSTNRAIALTALSLALAAVASAQYTATVLHPAGYFDSTVAGAHGSSQVGYATQWDGVNPKQYNAGYWNGTSGSFVNLHPAGAESSFATCSDVWYQYGYVTDPITHMATAARWWGSAANYVSFHPPAYLDSVITAVNGSCVGYGDITQLDPVSNNLYPAPHALIWTGGGSVNDVHPAGMWGSAINAVSQTNQAGWVQAVRGGPRQAAIWKDTAASFVSVHPSGFDRSEVLGMDSFNMEGYAIDSSNVMHAIQWNSPSTWVDLTPAGADAAQAVDVTNGEAVGYAMIGGQQHAAAWNGTAASFVDLQQYLPAGYVQSTANSIDSRGRIYGTAQKLVSTPNGNTYAIQAIMWTPDVLMPLYALTTFSQPINDGSGSESIFRYGHTIPVKIKLVDENGNPVPGKNLVISVNRIGSVSGAVNEKVTNVKADTGTAFHYNATTGEYVFNLSTSGLLSGSRYNVTATLAGTNLYHSVALGVRK